MTRLPEPARLGRTALPIVAVLLFGATIAAVLAFAGETLGYDFLAYRSAAVRLMDGRPLYDLGFEAAGGFGLFYYPPFFAPLILPFAWLSEQAAISVWTASLVAALVAGVALSPLSRTVRWWMLLLLGLQLLPAYAIKLGQVGPLLFLLFAIGWRWLDRPTPLGASAAVGAAIKVQPAIILAWAALTGRWRAVGVGIGVLAILGVAATLIAGTGAWSDFVTLVGRVADPITTPQNVTPGAIAYQLGMPADVALRLQWISTAAALVAVVAAARLATPEASFLVAVCASQLISPVLWDHYAILLVLPVGYLCASGRWWALLIPPLTALPLLDYGPRALYPLAFAVVLLATFWVGTRAELFIEAEAEPDAGTGAESIA